MAGYLIHIGSGKTGSTSIQNALLRDADLLRAQGIYYVPGLGGHHNEIEALVKGQSRWHRVHKIDFAGREATLVSHAQGLIPHLVTAAKQGICIISSEYLFSLSYDEIIRFLKMITSADAKVHVIAYIRRPSKYMLSALQQFIKHEHDIVGFFLSKYNFRAALENWDRVIGKNFLIVRPYSSDQLYNRDVVKDFEATIAQLAQRPIKLESGMPRSNKSLGAEQCIVMQELKRRFAIHASKECSVNNQAINRAVLRCSKISKVTPLRFTGEVASIIDGYHSDELSYLKAEFGVDFTDSDSGPCKLTRTGITALGAIENIADLVEYNSKTLSALKACVEQELNLEDRLL